MSKADEIEEMIKSTENSINETCKLLQDIPFINKKSADEMFKELGYEKDLHIDKKEQVWGEYFYNKRLDKENNDLRKLYRRTAEKLQDNGKDELARYFLAQINECPTFTVDSDIDYYEGYYNFKAKIEKIRNILKEIK